MYDHLLVKSITIITGQPTNHNSLLTKLKKKTYLEDTNKYLCSAQLEAPCGKEQPEKKKINYQARCGADQSNLFCMPWLQTSCQASQCEIENLHPAEEKEVAYWLI